jgi:uncharacterized damage-inducible protein DinB
MNKLDLSSPFRGTGGKEIQSIINNLENVLERQPWFGRPVYAILEEVNTDNVHKKPNGNGHSLIELLYHTLTWAEFVLEAVKEKKEKGVDYFENRDWIEIDPSKHTWQQGLQELKETHRQIINILQSKEDSFLKEMVEGRKYNNRFMLNGLIQHNIYHLGQIAYINKWLV